MTNPAPELAAHLQICPNVEDAVSIQRYEPHRVYLRAQMGCDGMVVLSDTYYPGWVAPVDGNEAPIFQVYNALRGVLVPRGSHEITMRFRPKPDFSGAALTAVAVLCG